MNMGKAHQPDTVSSNDNGLHDPHMSGLHDPATGGSHNPAMGGSPRAAIDTAARCKLPKVRVQQPLGILVTSECT